jgi:hypothetical protein
MTVTKLITQLYSTGCKLFYKGKPMKTEPVKDVLNSFIDWLPNDALLVAHNCKKFDANIIVSPVKRDYIHLFHFGMFQMLLYIFHGKTET